MGLGSYAAPVFLILFSSLAKNAQSALLRHNRVMHVSVIVTVYNERHTIERLLASLAAQTRRPDEVVICDGGSTDDTVQMIQTYLAHHPDGLSNVRVLVERGANISRGRNAAIAAAAGPLIAVTDAGVRLASGWLANLVAPWAAVDSPTPVAVAGFFLPDAEGLFQTAMAATVLPQVEEINPATFLPSSRSVAFTKAVWEKIHGYPEWLDYCEDLILDWKINAQRPHQRTAFVWSPFALVYFQPRATLRSFWRQYYRYARGDGKADLWRKRHLLRYVIYLVVLPALLGHAFWGLVARWLGWVGLIVGVAVYCGRPWQRLQSSTFQLNLVQRLLAAVWVPIIRVVGDVAKMVGYPVGLWWRWQRRYCAEIYWRRDE